MKPPIPTRGFLRRAVLVAVFAFSACKLWTVRPIESAQAADPGALGPVAYVDSIWSAKLLPAISSAAVDARTLLDALAQSPDAARAKYCHQTANGPCYLIVKGEGRVAAVDQRSRAGFLAVDVAPLDGRPDLTIQTGPILRGVALRDAAGIVQFTDFLNQLQFADVGNELNARVLKTVLGPLDITAWQGRTVNFEGPAVAGEASGPPIRDLVPVRLTVKEAR
jgi:predicted lipoprotein